MNVQVILMHVYVFSSTKGQSKIAPNPEMEGVRLRAPQFIVYQGRGSMRVKSRSPSVLNLLS